MTMGLDPDLDPAAEMAVSEMVDHLGPRPGAQQGRRLCTLQLRGRPPRHSGCGRHQGSSRTSSEKHLRGRWKMITFLLLLSAQVPRLRARRAAGAPDGVLLRRHRPPPRPFDFVVSGRGLVQTGRELSLPHRASEPALGDPRARRPAERVPPLRPARSRLSSGPESRARASTPGEDSASRYGFSRVEAWESFLPYIKQRLSRAYGSSIRTKRETRSPPGTRQRCCRFRATSSCGAVLWRRPSPGSTSDRRRPRSGRCAGRNHRPRWKYFGTCARTSAAALMAGIRAIGRQQPASIRGRRGERLLRGRRRGASFWPWTMSGPNAHLGNVVRSFFDYEHLDRAMKEGELVRMDVGCALGHYEGDVGRTVPVSGKFNADQRETLDLLVRAYRAGLSAMKAGVPLETVMERSAPKSSVRAETLVSEYARRAAEHLVAAPLRAAWHIHGVGLDGGETGTDTSKRDRSSRSSRCSPSMRMPTTWRT